MMTPQEFDEICDLNLRSQARNLGKPHLNRRGLTKRVDGQYGSVVLWVEFRDAHLLRERTSV